MSLQVMLGLFSLVPIIAAIPSSITYTLPNISTIQQQLGPHLSKNASLFFPGSTGYVSDTERWASNTESDFSVVVVPGTDKDVAATVLMNLIWSSVEVETADTIAHSRLDLRTRTIFASLRSTKAMALL